MTLNDNYDCTTLTTEIKSNLPVPVGRLIFVNKHKEIHHSIDLDVEKLELLIKELDRIIIELKKI